MIEKDLPLSKAPSPAGDWALDPTVTFLNHGSFGACPRAVLDVQRGWREKLETQPVRFLARDLEEMLAQARSEVAAFVGADGDDIVFVNNATTGINTVIRSLRFDKGDQVLTTDHTYNAVLNALRFGTAKDGAHVEIARVPFPASSPDEAYEAVLAGVTPRTRFVVVDHVTSPTALVLPIERLIPELSARGIDVMVDGAHGPGMLPLRLHELGAAYYTGNGHKWTCAPKGTAFLHVRHDRQPLIRPLVISHGANDRRTDRSRFQLEFDWQGTDDPTGFLSWPAAIDLMARILPGGWPAIYDFNHKLALAARDILSTALQTPIQSPPEMTGSMASIRLSGGPWTRAEATRRMKVMEAALRDRSVEVPLMLWPCPWLVDSGDLPADTRFDVLIRISAQVYNFLGQYERLASILSGSAGVNRSS